MGACEARGEGVEGDAEVGTFASAGEAGEEMRRLFAFLVFLAGAALAFGYPILASRLPPVPIGTWQAYSPSGGFVPIDHSLQPQDVPAEVYVDLFSSGSPKFGEDRAVLTLTASSAGKTVLAVPLTFAESVSREDAPQTPEMVYRTKAGTIETVDPSGASFTFTIGRGDVDQIDIARVDLVLERRPQPADPRAAPVGWIVMAVGAVALLLSFRGSGGAPPANPNSQPPPPRWGRDAADRK